MKSIERENNYCVIMAGGVGSRFWPYSRQAKPKQFLDFFGTGKSLLQMTVERFLPIVPVENMLIVTNVQYKELVLEQVPGLKQTQVLCEPCRRNTAPCIAYAVSHIKGLVAGKRGKAQSKDGIWEFEHGINWDAEELNANIIVAPSDHLILDNATFIETVKKGLDFTGSKDVLLTLGMRPTRPETGYGYIQIANNAEHGTGIAGNEGDIYPVKTFTEKPNLEMAKVFLKSGEFLWNSGIFLWNLRAIRHAFMDFIPELADKFSAGEKYMGTVKEEDFIQDMFPTCPNISIDYGVMEKAQNVYVLPSDFGWSDLGTWGSLYSLSDKDEQQNVSLHCDSRFYDASGNIVTLEKGKLAVIEGLKDMIVAESDRVLLICRRENEQHIKEYVTEVEHQYNGQFN